MTSAILTPAFCAANGIILTNSTGKSLYFGLLNLSDDVLKRITQLRAYFPNCGISSDLLVGFPGETDEEFNKTMELIKKASFSDMHIFPFSARPGTAAIKISNQINNEIKKKRAYLASLVASEMSRNFKTSQIGKSVEVLFERKRNGYWVGYSGNYVEIATADDVKRNDVKQVEIVSFNDGILLGKVL